MWTDQEIINPSIIAKLGNNELNSNSNIASSSTTMPSSSSASNIDYHGVLTLQHSNNSSFPIPFDPILFKNEYGFSNNHSYLVPPENDPYSPTNNTLLDSLEPSTPTIVANSPFHKSSEISPYSELGYDTFMPELHSQHNIFQHEPSSPLNPSVSILSHLVLQQQNNNLEGFVQSNPNHSLTVSTIGQPQVHHIHPLQVNHPSTSTGFNLHELNTTITNGNNLEYNKHEWETNDVTVGNSNELVPSHHQFLYHVRKEQSPNTSVVSMLEYSEDVDSEMDSKSSTESLTTYNDPISHDALQTKRRVGRPPKKDKKLKRTAEKKTGRLWEFIRDLLKNPKYCPSLVRWENAEEGHFRFVNSEKVAQLWGDIKGNPRMTYEKLSRAMRYYYKSHVFEPVLGRRLVYKFGYNATNWRPINPNFVQKFFN